MIAVLISLHNVKHSAEEGDGDWEPATTLYHRIHHGLTALAADGEPVTITLDDRSYLVPEDITDDTTPLADPPEAPDTTLPPHPSE